MSTGDCEHSADHDHHCASHPKKSVDSFAPEDAGTSNQYSVHNKLGAASTPHDKDGPDYCDDQTPDNAHNSDPNERSNASIAM